jgi:hypothetical protein
MGVTIAECGVVCNQHFLQHHPAFGAIKIPPEAGFLKIYFFFFFAAAFFLGAAFFAAFFFAAIFLF